METETNETGVVIINAKFSSNVFTGASSVEVLDSATGNSPQQAKHGLSVPLSLLLIPVAAIILCIVLRRRQKHSTKQAQQAIYQDRVGTASPGSGSPYRDFFQKGKSVHHGNRWESDVDDSEHEEHCPPYRHKGETELVSRRDKYFTGDSELDSSHIMDDHSFSDTYVDTFGDNSFSSQIEEDASRQYQQSHEHDLDTTSITLLQQFHQQDKNMDSEALRRRSDGSEETDSMHTIDRHLFASRTKQMVQRRQCKRIQTMNCRKQNLRLSG